MFYEEIYFLIQNVWFGDYLVQQGMREPAPPQGHPITPGYLSKYWAFASTSLRRVMYHSPLKTSVFIALGLGLPTVVLLGLLHPGSPFNTTLGVKTGGANIVAIDPDAPQELPPETIQPINNSQGFAQALHAQPTIDLPLQGFCHPLWGNGWLSQGIRGVTHNGRMEYAYDYAAAIGTPVYAMRSGRVVSMQDKYPDWGGNKEQIHRFNHVWLEHDGGYRSAYVHLQQGFRYRINLKVGDHVEVGQIIGYSGNSGWSSGPHLHVEVHRAGQRFRFTQTVPFAVASSCTLGREATGVALEPSPNPG